MIRFIHSFIHSFYSSGCLVCMWLQSPTYTMIHTPKRHTYKHGLLKCTSRRHHRRPRRPCPCRSWRCSPPARAHVQVHVSAKGKQAINNPALRHPTTKPPHTHQRLASVRVRHLLRGRGVLGVLVQALPNEAREAQRDALAALDLVERALVRGGEGEVCLSWCGCGWCVLGRGCLSVHGWMGTKCEHTRGEETVQHTHNTQDAPAARTSQVVLGSNQTSTSPMPVL